MFTKGYKPYNKGGTSWNKGLKLSDAHKEKLRAAKLGKKLSPEHISNIVESKRGFKHSEESKKKMSFVRTGELRTEETKRKISLSKKSQMAGSSHWNWHNDRSTLAKRQERNDMAYKEWRKQVWLRDNFKCKIANPDCVGRIEAHHILGWIAYPELRYQINNGITLCHFHHPRKRKEEAELSPYFQSLVMKAN